MYSLYVYDKGFNRIGIVEEIDSLQWLSLYAGAGEVKLVCAASAKNRALLQRGMRLWCTDQAESAVIAQVETNDDGKTAMLTVRAPLSVTRWRKRVVMGTALVKNVESAMLGLVQENRRGLPGTTAPPKGIPAVTDSQISWGSVLEAEASLAGARTRVEVTTPSLRVRTGPGTDEYKQVGSVKQGERYDVLDKCGNWYYIETDALDGWVSGDFVELI